MRPGARYPGVRNALQVYSPRDLEELEHWLATFRNDPEAQALAPHAFAALLRPVPRRPRSPRVSVLCPKIAPARARKGRQPPPFEGAERGRAMSATETATKDDLELVQGIFDRIAADLGMIIDRSLEVDGVRAERVGARPAGEGGVHISFRFGVVVDGQGHQGCLLVPLADAITMAGYLMMQSEEEVALMRDLTEIDVSMKEAMLEVGNFIAGACDAIVRRSLPEGSAVRSEGCQGVRADVRPALEYEEGDELIVGYGSMHIDEYPDFKALLLLPRIAAE